MMDRRLLALTALLFSFVVRLGAQTVKGTPPAGAPPPPLTYEGLVPGVSTLEDAKKKLGEPAFEAAWYSWKMSYPSKRSPGHFDTIQIQDGRRIGDIEACGAPEGFETLERVREKLGEPEMIIEFSKQTIADYSAKGVRLTFDAQGNTIGTAHFVHGFPRVHPGERHFLSLRSLRQGPQKAIGSAAPDAKAEELLAGAAEADISPQEPDWLGSVKYVLHDHLMARAVVFAQGKIKLALVGGDIFGMRRIDIEPIEKRLKESGVTHLLVAMSHVHSAGDPIGIYGFYPEKFVKRIQDGIFEAVTEALSKARRVKELRGASDELPLVGARVEGISRNARNPGILDPQIAVLQATGEDSRPIFTIAHFACHPEGIETEKGKPLEVSADYPGYLCNELREMTGAQAVFLNGAVGGMVSGDTRARTHAEAAGQGQRIAMQINRLLGFAMPMPLTLQVDRRRIEIPVTNPKMVAFEMSTGRPTSYRGRSVSEMSHIRIGEAELISVPGELLPEVSFEILERMKGYPRMIVGLANDQLGYMVPVYDFRAGEYEESMSLGPAAALVVLRQAWSFLEGQ